MNKNSIVKENLQNMVNTFVSKCKSYEYRPRDFSDSESSNMSSSEDETISSSSEDESITSSSLEYEDDEVLSETSDETDSISSCDTAILAVTSKLNIDNLPKLPFLNSIEEYKLDFFEDAFVV